MDLIADLVAGRLTEEEADRVLHRIPAWSRAQSPRPVACLRMAERLLPLRRPTGTRDRLVGRPVCRRGGVGLAEQDRRTQSHDRTAAFRAATLRNSQSRFPAQRRRTRLGWATSPRNRDCQSRISHEGASGDRARRRPAENRDAASRLRLRARPARQRGWRNRFETARDGRSISFREASVAAAA